MKFFFFFFAETFTQALVNSYAAVINRLIALCSTRKVSANLHPLTTCAAITV